MRNPAFYLFVVLLGGLLWGLLLPAGPCAASDISSVFTVRDVDVDITTSSAAKAREQAITKAQEKAFLMLAGRILRREDAESLDVPDTALLRRLIQDFEIRNEKISSVRYKASFVFRFKENAVRQYFASQNFSYTDVGSKPVLVLPFYQQGSRVSLWGQDNPWLETWGEIEGNQGLVPVVVPIGDLNDVTSVNENEALAYRKDSLEKMISRYGAGEAIILIAAQPKNLESGGRNFRAQMDSTARLPLNIFIYRTDRQEPEFVTRLSFEPEKEESRRSYFSRAAAEVFALLQKNWKEKTLVNPDEKNNLQVLVTYKSLDEWVQIKRALENMQGLLGLDYVAISTTHARVRLFFKGSEDRLRLALAQEDMDLSRPKVNIFALFQEESSQESYGRAGNSWSDSPLLYELKANF